MKLLLLLLMACTATRLEWKSKMPLPVAVVTPIPGMEKPTCYIEPKPVPPEFHELPPPPDGEYDIQTRIWVHRRDYEELLQYIHDMDIWISSMQTCLEKMVQQ